MDARRHGPRLCGENPPKVAGEIVKLPIVDNQFVHKGDLLMQIDPRNYSIAVRQAEAAVQQTHAAAERPTPRWRGD